MRHVNSVATALFDLPKPTVAAVRGVAVGAGCNLALAGDLVLATPHARFAQIFAKRALSLDCGGSWLLPRLVGLRKAKELALLGDELSGEAALAEGLVSRVVPDADLDGEAAALARRLADGPATALSMSKRMLNDSFAMSFPEALEREAVAQTVKFQTPDFREAITAFVERRPARFRPE